jgi:Uma2 family endonuclease
MPNHPAPVSPPATLADDVPPLEEGDHLDQPEFHRRYQRMPPGVKAELIGGIVFMPSPQKKPHGRIHRLVMRWLDEFEEATPGTEAFDNSTTILGPVSEPQPDACLLIMVAGRGQTMEVDEYIVGAPELIIEVASSTSNIDLHRKRDDYLRGGVKEYLVIVLRPARALWLVRRGDAFHEMTTDAEGILRSETFPGLWLDPTALLGANRRRLLEVLRQGLASPEHAAFVASLHG